MALLVLTRKGGEGGERTFPTTLAKRKLREAEPSRALYLQCMYVCINLLTNLNGRQDATLIPVRSPEPGDPHLSKRSNKRSEHDGTAATQGVKDGMPTSHLNWAFEVMTIFDSNSVYLQ